jgi:hypothetical protein
LRYTIPGHIPSSWQRPHRSAVVWLVIATLAYDAFLLLTGPAEGTLDARFVYGPQYIGDLLDAQGEDGRRSYFVAETVDFGFIILYTVLWHTWLRFLRIRGALPWPRGLALAVVPGLFDVMETGSILALLSAYPDLATPWTTTAMIGTPLKWLSLGAMIAWIGWGEIRLRRKRAGRNH